MLRTSSFTGSLTILKLIDVPDKDEVCESGGNGTNLSNSSTSKKSIGAGYLTSGGAKKGGGNTKKGFKAAKGSDYLFSAAKKAFNHLWHAFIQAFILQHFKLEWCIWIKTNASSYAIVRILN